MNLTGQSKSRPIRFYVERAEKFLASDKVTWTDFQAQAWSTTDRAEAGRVSREYDAKVLPAQVSPW